SPTTPTTCGTVTNTATGGATNEATANEGDNSSTASITVQCPNVTISKTADAGAISAGDTASYTIVLTNTGTGIARSVTRTDTLPAGVAWNEDNADCSAAG